MNPLHEQFITEARELIAQATDDLLALDREGPTPERVDRVFRAFHTLKGSARGVGAWPMARAAEAVEAALPAEFATAVAALATVAGETRAAIAGILRPA